MIAHTFDTEQEAINALAELDTARGFPKGNTLTSAVIKYQEDYYYFVADDKHKDYFTALANGETPTKPIYLIADGVDEEGGTIMSPSAIDITGSLEEIEIIQVTNELY